MHTKWHFAWWFCFPANVKPRLATLVKSGSRMQFVFLSSKLSSSKIVLCFFFADSRFLIDLEINMYRLESTIKRQWQFWWTETIISSRTKWLNPIGGRYPGSKYTFHWQVRYPYLNPALHHASFTICCRKQTITQTKQETLSLPGNPAMFKKKTTQISQTPSKVHNIH